eukprot:578331_1
MSIRRQPTPGPRFGKDSRSTTATMLSKRRPTPGPLFDKDSQSRSTPMRNRSKSTPRRVPPKEKKLPPLPIPKRALPNLPQSKSCSRPDSARVAGVAIPSATRSKPHVGHVSTGSNWSFHSSQSSGLSQLSFASSTRSLRNLFAKVQQKVGGSKTKLTNNSNANNGLSITHEHHASEPEMNHLAIKSKWRPNLDFILNDEELLEQLIGFMTKQYNEENVLFLEAVSRLESNINELLMFDCDVNLVAEEKINVEIASIYATYIIHDAHKQVNLSSQCFSEIMSHYQRFDKAMTLKDKAAMFIKCGKEISQLIQTSVLSWFYQSDEFQYIARSRNIFTNDRNVDKLFAPMRLSRCNVSDVGGVDYDSDDIAYDQTNTESKDDEVYFDCHSSTKWTQHNKYMLSSNGFGKNSGYHEWKIKIVRTSGKRQEFGVVSTFNKNIHMNEFGICDTPMFGARVVYGYNKLVKMDKNRRVSGTEHSFYYASYNKDNSVRCTKDLSSIDMHQRAWRTGDVITIGLNLSKGIVKFYLNGKKVRKTISIERNNIYYPIILYSGKCEYQVIA